MNTSVEKKITIQTKPFGELEINQKDILEFPNGLYGFEDLCKFIILEPQKKNIVFYWLQSIEIPSLAFILTKPTFFIPTYQPVLDLISLKLIGSSVVEDLELWSIVTIPAGNHSKMTLNLQGPILVNPKKSLGAQFVSMNNQHTTKVSILNSVNSHKKEKVYIQDEKKISSMK